MTADRYVQSVIHFVPDGLPLREQIAMELRSHIAERRAHGQAIDEVVRQLGDPLTLAESYLAALPRETASLARRFAAKLIDAVIVAAIAVALSALAWTLLPRQIAYFIPVICSVGAVIGFVAYTAIAEYHWSGTIGKRWMGIQVVRESGARISVGQALLRQLPFFGQFFVIDAAFALFTERRQRAFELLTKTRAVAVLLCFTLLSRP
jgi:uncharacterized RDD family membrane protein YckC